MAPTTTAVLGATLLFVAEAISGLPWMNGAQPRAFKLKLRGNSAYSHHAASQCLGLPAGGGAVVRAVRQRYGQDSYLVARPESLTEQVGQVPLHATYEALLNQCAPSARGGESRPWLADLSVGDSELSALASSVGCAVAVFDPEAEDSKAVAMTRCVNDPQSSFVVLPSTVAAASTRNFTVTVGALGAEEVGAESKTTLLQRGRAGTTTTMRGVTLDSLFVGNEESDGNSTTVTNSAMAQNIDANADWSVSDVAMLKITPHGCCGPSATLNALRGASTLLDSGRVRLLVTELNFDPNSTEEVLDILAGLESRGYRLLHAGPIDSPEIEITEDGNYPLFRTDAQQLRELHATFGRIRSFDERSGYRIYGDGLSLDRQGRYFDYTNFVVAQKLGSVSSKKLNVKAKAKPRFQNGMWWLQDPTLTMTPAAPLAEAASASMAKTGSNRTLRIVLNATDLQ